MKYDASMTEFHGDIVAAVRLMCGKDTVARSNSEGASPAPLRDYLKNRYGYNGKCSNGAMYQNTPSKGMEISLDREVNNDGDTSITLSWSQVAKFIRDNPSEIFEEENKPVNAENSSPIEAKTYLEIFKEHYPNVNCNTLYDDYCPGNFFKGAMEVQHEPCTDECEKCWNTNANEEWCETADCPEEWKAAEPPAPAPAQTETAVVFNYSELDSETAEQLGKISENVINIKKKYIFDMAEQVKKAHDLLANHYGGKFGAWCESIGISRDTGDNMVRVAEIFGNISEEQQANLSKLKPSLLYEAARPSAPVELVEAVKNGDITTHNEYIKLKKELERTKETAKNQSLTIDDLLKRQSELVKQNSGINLELSNANKKIEELENRPVEVAVDVDELNRRVEKVSIELQNQTARQIAAEREDFARKLNSMEDENDELRAELEKAKAKAGKTNDNVKTVLMRMTLDELAELAEVVPDGKFKTIIKKAQVLRV